MTNKEGLLHRNPSLFAEIYLLPISYDPGRNTLYLRQ